MLSFQQANISDDYTPTWSFSSHAAAVIDKWKWKVACNYSNIFQINFFDPLRKIPPLTNFVRVLQSAGPIWQVPFQQKYMGCIFEVIISMCDRERVLAKTILSRNSW